MRNVTHISISIYISKSLPFTFLKGIVIQHVVIVLTSTLKLQMVNLALELMEKLLYPPITIFMGLNYKM